MSIPVENNNTSRRSGENAYKSGSPVISFLWAVIVALSVLIIMMIINLASNGGENNDVMSNNNSSVIVNSD